MKAMRLLVIWLLVLPCFAAAADRPGGGAIPLALQALYPRPVHYRYANNFKVTSGQEDAAYRQWMADYGRAMGAELDRRVALTDAGRREVIRRVMKEHPAFEFEGGEAVTIGELAVHAASGAVARDFERGVALANPSLHAQTFDLAHLFPGRRLRRIQATPNQDGDTNNGQPVGDTVTLGPHDGLFLTSDKQ